MNLTFQIPDCRHVFLPPVQDGLPARRCTIGDAACCGGIFSQDKQVTNTLNEDARTAASEGSIAVGQSGKYIEAGGTDVAGSSGNRFGTTELTAGSDVNISTADPEVLKAALATYGELGMTALQQYGDLSRSDTSAFSSFAKQTHEQQSGDLATLLSSLGQLQQATDAEQQQKKFTLYTVLAVLSLVGLLGWFFFRRK